MKVKLYLLGWVIMICSVISAKGQSLKEVVGQAETDTANVYLPADSLFARFLKEKQIPVTACNRMTLLKSGRSKFEHLFEDIKKAENYIHLEYFNFRSDSIAKELFTLLAEKAKEGVTISPIRFPYINHVFCRDHQKIVVIDGKVGYTGGMNIADYYINGLPEIGPWRDMHIRIEGPAVQYLEKAFLGVWNKETHEGLKEGQVAHDTLCEGSGRRVAIVQRIPKVCPEIMREAYIAALDAAERKVQIINPYFTPTRKVRNAIKRAAERGVRVEIMIPGKSDISFTPDAGFYIANKLRKAGAHIYVFNGGFHHSKIMMVDERFCTVGSTNLNSRSLHYDYEINAFILDLPTTAELGEVFQNDKLNSTIMTREEYKKRSVWRRFVGWFAHLFTPVI